MKSRLPIAFLASLIVAILISGFSIRAEQYVAFSLSSAKRTLQTPLKEDWRETQSELYNLGGMTRVRGLVIDRTNSDVIVIGLRDKSRPALTLDDLSIAFRARLVKGEWPLVSIDFTDQTKTTKMQNVRYEGGIEDTGFGSDMFDADLRLKKIDQGTLASGSPHVQSGFDVFARSIESGESKEVLTRFWFYPTLPVFRIRQDVASFEGLKVAVFTEVMAAKLGAKTIDPKSFSDPAGEAFARQMSDHFEDVSVAHPSIARLPGLLELVALAHSAELMQPSPELSFWLSEFPVKLVRTPKEQELLHRKKEFTANNMEYSATIQGGVHLTALALRLKSGDPHALRDAVLSTRPSASTLAWTFVSGTWVIPTSGTVKTEDALPLVAQAMFLADQKRFDDAFACLSRASEAAPDLKDEIATCRAEIVFEREYSSLQKQASKLMSSAMLSIKNKAYHSQDVPEFNAGTSKAGSMELAEAMKTLVEVQSRKAEPYLLVAALHWGPESEKGHEVLTKGLDLMPQSGALHYFRAKFHLIADDRKNAIADLRAADNLLKTNDPSGLAEAAKTLLAQIEANIEGNSWKKFTDREDRYSFEYPADWTVFTPKEFREFMGEQGFEVPKEFEAEQGLIVVDPNKIITVSIEFKDVRERVRHDQLRGFWRRVASQPQEMERKYSPFFPGFKVKSAEVLDFPSSLRSECRYQFPMNIMGISGLVRGRKTGIYYDSADTCVVMVECKAWDKQFDNANDRYFGHLINSLRIGKPR